MKAYFVAQGKAANCLHLIPENDQEKFMLARVEEALRVQQLVVAASSFVCGDIGPDKMRLTFTDYVADNETQRWVDRNKKLDERLNKIREILDT